MRPMETVPPAARPLPDPRYDRAGSVLLSGDQFFPWPNRNRLILVAHGAPSWPDRHFHARSFFLFLIISYAFPCAKAGGEGPAVPHLLLLHTRLSTKLSKDQGVIDGHSAGIAELNISLNQQKTQRVDYLRQT